MNCFFPAIIAGVLLLSGCAGQQQKPPEAEFFAGNSPLTITHIITRADDGSAIRITVDGHDAGLLKQGEKTTLHLPAGKHIIGGYVETLFGYGRVTIPSLTVNTEKHTTRQVVYSIRLNNPAFTDRGTTTETPLPQAVASVGESAAHDSDIAAPQPTGTSTVTSINTSAPAATATTLPSITTLPSYPPSITVQQPGVSSMTETGDHPVSAATTASTPTSSEEKSVSAETTVPAATASVTDGQTKSQ